MKKILEIACFNVGSALIAEQGGADRIEFCSNYWEGGLTPLERHLREARERVQLPMHAMIRCRGGDFIYSDAETTEMVATIKLCRNLKFEGVVFGALDENSEVDVEACKKFMEAADSLNLVFHRAFDHCNDPDAAMECLISLGIGRVLSSGGGDDIVQGRENLKRLQQKYGKEIIIIAGGGLRSSNFGLALQTGCSEFHSSALTNQTVTADAGEIRRMKKYVEK